MPIRSAGGGEQITGIDGKYNRRAERARETKPFHIHRDGFFQCVVLLPKRARLNSIPCGAMQGSGQCWRVLAEEIVGGGAAGPDQRMCRSKSVSPAPRLEIESVGVRG